ncbi:hypothetical protein GCM10011491_43320 [Brucella endophytica]|uniref:Uncharacterized protein n=1 Tax=Brucella endophytica TaxID=1963359 RepID=A0A916SSA0_9HYPH|nr:hypothetical protein GCM10011491_43320 [Brucella endophytica]
MVRFQEAGGVGRADKGDLNLAALEHLKLISCTQQLHVHLHSGVFFTKVRNHVGQHMRQSDVDTADVNLSAFIAGNRTGVRDGPVDAA